MISSNTYLHFNGDCEAALTRYAQVLDAHVVFMMRTKDSPMAKDCPPEMLDRVMHATFTIGDVKVMASDVPAPPTARELEADESGETFEKAFRAVVPSTKPASR